MIQASYPDSFEYWAAGPVTSLSRTLSLLPTSTIREEVWAGKLFLPLEDILMLKCQNSLPGQVVETSAQVIGCMLQKTRRKASRGVKYSFDKFNNV